MSNVTGLRKTCETILADRGHDLYDFIADHLDKGATYEQIAEILERDFLVFVSTRQLRRWAA